MEDRVMVSPNRAQEHNSLYNLTVDEVQNSLGKPLSSMNVHEFRQSVVSVDEGVQNPPSFVGDGPNLSGNLGEKTVDELWKEMNSQFLPLRKTTLEDFLVRAGMININPRPLLAVEGSGSFDGSGSGYEKPSAESGYGEGQMGVGVPVPGISTADSPAEMNRKRRNLDTAEKSIERRKKRMIKNRESAARSRARKQAYTHQLEVEVNRLRTRNMWLKRQKEVDMMLSSETTVLPKYQLRRTSSTSF